MIQFCNFGNLFILIFWYIKEGKNMPLPLLFIGIGATAGALGIEKTVKASMD